MPAHQPRLALSIDPRLFDQISTMPMATQRGMARLLSNLRTDPSYNAIPLTGEKDVHRARLGDYRVLFTQKDGWLHVYTVESRGSVYQRAIKLPRDEPSSAAPDFVGLPDVESPAEADELLGIDVRHLVGRGLTGDLITTLRNWDGSADGLEELIDAGVPDDLVELAIERLPATEAGEEEVTGVDPPPARGRPPAFLVRRNVLDSFFGRLVSLPRASGIEQITIVSPWISEWRGSESSLERFIRFATARRLRVTVITRPPEHEWHEKALAQLQRVPRVEILTYAKLHAKYYICDKAPVFNSGGRFALLASANFTARSFDNTEVGIFVRGTGELEGFFEDLEQLTTELRSSAVIYRI